MVELPGIRVKIHPEIDKQGLNKGARDVEKGLKGIKIGKFGMPKGLGGGPGKPLKGMGMFGGGDAKGGGMAGILGKGAGGMLGSLAAMTIVLEGIFKAIKSVINILSEASPFLKGVFKLLRFGIMMVLKPLGDALGMILMPIAMWLMNMQKKHAPELQAAFETGDPGTMIEVWFTGMLSDIAGDVGDAIVDALVGFGEYVYDSLCYAISHPIETLVGIGKFIWDALVWAITGWTDFVVGVGKWIAEWLPGVILSAVEGLGKLGLWIWDSIVNAIGSLGDILGGFVDWLWKSITGGIGALGDILGGFVDWLWKSITGGIGTLGDILGKFGQWLWDTITQAITGAIEGAGDFLGDVGQGVGDFFGGIGDFLGLQHGGIVTKPTMAVIGEAGPEAVIPLDKLGSIGGGSVTINFNAPIYGVDDLESAIRSSIDDYSSNVRSA